MRRTLSLIILMLFAGITGIQAQSAGQRAQDLAVALNKTKYKKKEKIDLEFYIDVKNIPAAKSNAADYSGVYRADDHYRLDLQVSADGTAAGSGSDKTDWLGSEQRKFTLKNAHVTGALLTAIKVYENGVTEEFEAVFVNRTVASGVSPEKVTRVEAAFGLGFIQTRDTSVSRFFLEKQN